MIWWLMAIGILLLVAALWMFFDAYDRMGLFGAALWAIGFYLFPPIIIVYWLMLHATGLAAARRARVSREKEAWFKKYAPAMRTHREDNVKPPSRAELEAVARLRLPEKIEEHELDERIEELVKAGKHKDAVAYARDMLEMARELKDSAQVRRYEKYVFLLELGPLREPSE